MKYIVLALLLLFAAPTFAENPHHKHIDGIDGINGTAGINSLSNTDISILNNYTDIISSEVLAGSMAMSNLDYSSSTNHLQVGVAVGYHNGEQAIAFGLGKLVTKWDMMFRGSVVPNMNGHTSYGIGMVWKTP